MTGDRGAVARRLVRAASIHIGHRGAAHDPANDARLLTILRDDLRPVLRSSVDTVLRAVRPAVALDAAPDGPHRWGGLPPLPPEVAWPRHRGRPMSLVALVDAAHAAGLLGPSWPYPRHGTLLLFHIDPIRTDVDHYADLTVGALLHVHGTHPDRPPPPDLSERAVYAPERLAARHRLTLPPPDSEGFDRLRTYDRALRRAGPVLGAVDDHLLGHPETATVDRRVVAHLRARTDVDWGPYTTVTFMASDDDLAEGRLGAIDVGHAVD